MLLTYRESPQGQMLHEGISEAGAMGSTIAAGTSYATHGEPMIPVYIFYSMFGFQRTADSIWAFADQLGRGFLIGATAGRTTLTGEGLQHADGHSPLIAATNPAASTTTRRSRTRSATSCRTGCSGCTARPTSTRTARTSSTTSPSTTSRPCSCPSRRASTSTASCGVSTSPSRPTQVDGDERPHLQLLASGVAVPWALKAQQMLAEEWQVRADVWSVTSWNELARDALRADEYNLLHPTEEPADAVRHVEAGRHGRPGARGVSDYMRAVPDQISQWVGSDWHSLGTDGFGFADTRAAARRFFRIDAESIVVGALEALAKRGEVDRSRAAEAIAQYRIDDPTAVAHVKQEGAGA